VSKLVAEHIAQEDHRGAFQVFKTAFVILTVFGVCFSLLLYFGADFFTRNIAKDPRAYYSLISISPAIFLVSVMSVFRGFFQGQQEMAPTAYSQIVEQTARILAVIFLVYLLLPRGLEYAAAGAAFGAAAGALFSLFCLLIIYLKRVKAFKEKMEEQSVHKEISTMKIFYRIAAFSIPITLGSLVIPIINLIDLMVVPLRLHHIGYSTEQATALYGQLTGMANSVIQFPVLITISLAMTLVPAISEAMVLKDQSLIRSRTELANRATLYFAMPATFGLFILAEPTSVVLFNNAQAAYPLAYLSFAVIFLSLYTATSGILQGLGQIMEPVKNMLVGAAIKLALSWFLTAIPALHVGGAALSTVLGFLVASYLNTRKVCQLTGLQFDYRELLLKPFIAAVSMSCGVLLVYRLPLVFLASVFEGRMALALLLTAAVILGVIIYLLTLLLIGGLKEADLLAVPRFGEKLLELARRFRLVKK
jgi:stage V sporulation protein B